MRPPGDRFPFEDEAEETLALAGLGKRPVLGSNPFHALDGPDPLDEWLEALDQVTAGRLRAAPAGNVHPETSFEEIPESPLAPLFPLPRRRAPAVAEVELPSESRGLERLLGDDVRRRLVALLEGGPAENPYDPFGCSATSLRRAFPIFYALYRLYFRVRSEGHENVPPEGPVILASNHGGILPFDGAMAVIDLLLHTDPPRLARAIVDRWAGTLPFVNVFYARVGQVIGTRENLAALLREGEPVLIFPEGIEGVRKPLHQRYRVQTFRVGFVEHALRSGAPIVPMAILGSDDQAPILYDVKPVARWLGLPTAPITPTFPWLGPLGLLPYPVRYRIVYGEPLLFHERFGPAAAEDARTVRALAVQVRRSVQLLIDRNR